ncbi:MAG TPA: division/cell wall cluster transcriptional repressor MraZ [Candidatus Goldiibacteriota bacterium]|nr:division/cell wall cluster transcriptional repressor MraZ [Candidatus Goldiibacteriota bacterium]HPI02455.1 division/cell wall cluster transcriptional repressor MraZ [Candidatus Goldiibacteriota bacterium]HRQ43099.1 division/cell wall cluster transcriptional repressor MraZ [Candidatus Goldiibacteriota bacterium]
MIKTGFIGQHEHSLDEKGRVSIPSRYKKYIEEITVDPDKRNAVVLSKSKDKCIEVFAPEKWEQMMGKYEQNTSLEEENRDLKYMRSKLSNTDYANVDKSGRIIIPQFLKDYAGISKNVVFAGIGDRFEIWDKKTFDDNNK